MADVANLVARLRLDSSGFERGMTRAAGIAARFAVTGVGVAAAAVAVLTARAFETVDAQAKVADQLGDTTERMAGLQVAASLAGIENDRMTKALQNGARRIAEAAQGIGTGVNALKQLGLSAAQLVQQSPSQQLNAIAGALGNVANQNERARLLYDIFGRQGREFLSLIGNGTAALDEAAQFAEEFGFALTRVDAAKIEAANDATTKVGFAMQGLGRQLAVRIAPFVTEVSNRLLDFGSDGTRAAAAVNEGMLVVRFTVARVADVIDGVRATFHSLVGTVQGGIALVLSAAAKANDIIGNPFDLAEGQRAAAAIFESNASDSFESAAEALERIWSDENTRQVNQFFGNVEDRAAAAAREVAALAEGTLEGTRAFGALDRVTKDKKTGRTREASAAQFDRRFIDPRALGGSREQAVRAPQLDVTNAHLSDILERLRRSEPAALFT